MADETAAAEPRQEIVIPKAYSFAAMREELDTTIRVKQDNLDRRRSTGRMGAPEAGLAMISIAKLKSLAKYLDAIAGAQGDKAALPEWLREAGESEEAARGEAAAWMVKHREAAASQEIKDRAEAAKLAYAERNDPKPAAVKPVEKPVVEPAPVVETTTSDIDDW